MLEDRNYMRQPAYGRTIWHTVTVRLLLINLAVFIAQELFAKVFPWDEYFGLSFAGLRRGYIWQLLTFQFLHGGFYHIIFNSIALFTVGLAVEQLLGAKRFVQLYLISGLVGGVVHVLGGLVWPQHFGVIVQGDYRLYIPVVGASAGVFGLVAAFATMYFERNLTVLLYFVLPITVSGKVLLGVSAGISILGVLIGKGNVAHGAHLGGMLGGWLMLRYFARRPVYETRVHQMPPPPPPPTQSETDFVSQDVDPILEKISRQGIQSLTAAERKVLEAARRRMDGR